MQGWTEEEIRNTDLMAPCGLYCGACAVYIATRDSNAKLKAIMGGLYGTRPEETECLGCMQPAKAKTIYAYCKSCPMRECVVGRGYYSCHQCDEWPCPMVENFMFATGKRVMKRTIPVWRAKVAKLGHKDGSAAWARSELERYHCPSCGAPLFRGAQNCRACKTPVADQLDGSL